MKNFSFLSLFVILPSLILAQGLINNGAKIVIETGTTVYVDGDANGNFTNASGGELDLNGVLTIEGDFVNNATNNVFRNRDTDGEVIFAGGTQSITTNQSDMSNFIDFEKVTINNGSTTNLTAGSASTINGAFLVNSSGKFVLQTPSDENPTGSLITNGTIISTDVDDIVVERYYSVGGRYQYFSVPVDDVDIYDFSVSPVTGNHNTNVYSYNESYEATVAPNATNYATWNDATFQMYNAWVSVATSGTGTYFDNAVGYASYNEGDLDINYNGGNSKLHNNASYTPALSYNFNDGENISNTDYFDGWNLIGNPYPCAIDWGSGTWTKTNIQNTVYFWDGSNYVYYNSATTHTDYADVTVNKTANGSAIPAMQSFFVKATGVTPALTIPEDARIHSGNSLYKNSKDFVECSLLKLNTEYNNLSDELVIRFINEATYEVDDNYDAYKIFSTASQLPQFFSITEDTDLGIPLTINSLPIPENYNGYSIIPIGFLAKESGIYDINVVELTNIDFNSIYLVDKNDPQNHVEVDLLKYSEYSCFIEEGEIRDRFYLFVSPEAITPSGLFEENYTNKNVNIYSNSNQVYLNLSSDEDLNGILSIYDVLGKKVYESNANSLFSSFTLNSATGNYIVKYRTNTNIFTQKVFIIN